MEMQDFGLLFRVRFLFHTVCCLLAFLVFLSCICLEIKVYNSNFCYIRSVIMFASLYSLQFFYTCLSSLNFSSQYVLTWIAYFLSPFSYGNVGARNQFWSETKSAPRILTFGLDSEMSFKFVCQTEVAMIRIIWTPAFYSTNNFERYLYVSSYMVQFLSLFAFIMQCLSIAIIQ